MKNQFKLLSLFVLLITFSCQNNSKKTNTTQNDLLKLDSIKSTIAGSLITNCYSCHSPSTSFDKKIAPSLSEVKAFYLNKYKTEKEFIFAMNDYVNNPTIAKAIMSVDVEKYGIMPNMQFDQSEVKKIVEYLYANPIDTEEWIIANKNNSQAKIDKSDFNKLGRQIVMNTKKQLGKNLKKTILTKGSKAAVSYCNLNAIPILDSMSRVHHAKISRVSNRPRNNNNMANTAEINFIMGYQVELNKANELKPILIDSANSTLFYMPIVTNQMCMKCHGKKNEIDKNTYNEIKLLYPNDLATGYSPQQIRGVWKVIIKK